ncbi:MAG: SHOCT domain-containing protein [Thermomicrobiales bacterium]|nr:SHOCT domain-containing protein [Thermomicrobiales bacterium]
MGSQRPDSADPAGASPVPWRKHLATALLVIFMVSAGLAVPAVWARNQVLDTDAFVRTVAPLAEDPAFQDTIANQVTSILTAQVTSSNLLPGGDAVVGALVPIAAAAAIDTIVTSFVHSPRFPAVWETTARTTHAGFEALITGGNSNLYNSADGRISLDLTPIIQVVLNDLAARGIPINLPSQDLTFVVFESATLAELQVVTQRLNDAAVLLSIVAVLSLLGYVLLSPHRLVAFMVAGLGLALSMIVVLLFIIVARWYYLGHLSAGIDKEAARILFDTLLHYLRWGLRITGLIGLLVSGAIYLKLRHSLAFASQEDMDRSLYVRWPVLGRLENAVAGNRVAASGIWMAIVAAILFLQNWTDFGWVITLVMIGLAGLVLIRRANPVPEAVLNRAPRAAAPEAAASPALSQSLQQVAELNARGLLTDEEFALAKSAILAGAA